MENQIEALIKKSASSHTADDSMKFAQAALNAANALSVLRGVEREAQKYPR